MAYITFDTKKLQHNYKYLDNLFKKNNIQWSIVTKLLCGNKSLLAEVVNLGVKQICDSRIMNLKMIKSINPNIETIFIKLPSSRNIEKVIQYADISVNTEFKNIKLLSNEAVRQSKKHKIIILIELGELREGVLREEFVDFYYNVFNLPNIEVVGIGTNLSCLYGVLPNHDKLIQLSLYKQLVEEKFNKKIPMVSGGSSVTIPLIFQKLLPKGVNHFRVGESLFLGTDVYHNSTLKKMHSDTFKLYAEIIELNEKHVIPTGQIGHNVDGHSPEFDSDKIGDTTFRAIIELGLLDVDVKHIIPIDSNICVVGASSDMIVMDLGSNKNKYKVGDLLEFKIDYMGTLRLLNSKYIDIKLIK
ncbi:MAG: amino-acid racemase [Bacteroidetes bacterium GWE2_29_8]|nr:MAG: amino-acid racemase [Bacteroidetes bacterium GWE2_29_8]OFY14615.1 MAG: amino-acid racemase [Bacteroidetes bacterium GWF2_29_10]